MEGSIIMSTLMFSKNTEYKHKLTMKSGNITCSQGNEKLPEDSYIARLIFSLPAKVTCLWSTAHCRKACYAAQGVYLMKTVRECQNRNYQSTLDPNWVSDMIDIITRKIQKLTPIQTLEYRIHESGDFYSFQYFVDWIYIADFFKDFGDKVNFSAYTKALPFIDRYCQENNCSVEELPIHFISSIWDDTTEEMVELTKKLGLGTYSAGLTWAESDFTCHDGLKCNECLKCYRGKQHITVEITDGKSKAKKRLENLAKAGKSAETFETACIESMYTDEYIESLEK